MNGYGWLGLATAGALAVMSLVWWGCYNINFRIERRRANRARQQQEVAGVIASIKTGVMAQYERYARGELPLDEAGEQADIIINLETAGLTDDDQRMKLLGIAHQFHAAFRRRAEQWTQPPDQV